MKSQIVLAWIRNNLHISDNTPSAEEQAAVLEKTGGNIPDGYAFSHYSSYDDIASVAEYLKETYKNLLGMDRPQTSIFGGDYNIYLQQSYKIEFYNASDDMTEEILNYTFNRVAFYCDDNGDLYMVRIYQPNLSEKVADYPIISTEEAEELLLNGNYITTVPYEMPGEKYIAKAELVYRTCIYEEYYMPYYRFYVELPDMEEDNGVKHFGMYYVPAVNEAYITDIPIWDGSFNG